MGYGGTIEQTPTKDEICDITMIKDKDITYGVQQECNKVDHCCDCLLSDTKGNECHGLHPGILAGKLCVPDAQMPNTVCVPTPHAAHNMVLAHYCGVGT
jgi:hypothetical protein